MASETRKSDLLLLTFNSFVWGTGWSAIKYCQDRMGPVELNVWTLGISLPAILPFAYAEYRRNEALRRALTARDYLDYGIMGLLGLMAMTLLFNWGAQLSLAVNGALITTAVPILTAVIAVIVLGERLTRARVLGLAIAFVGVLVISDIRWSSVGVFGPHLRGNLLLLAGAVGNAIYVVYGKKLLDHSGPITVLFWGQVIGLVGSLPFLVLDPIRWGAVQGYSLTTWLSLLFLGTVFYSFTVIIFFKILVRIDAGQIMIFAYLQPVFGVVMAAVLLNEQIAVSMVMGGLLVVAGTLVVAFERPAVVEVSQEARG